MATVINLPEDQSFFGGGGQRNVGLTVADFLNKQMEQQQKQAEEKKKMEALQAAFDPEASDSEVASNLFGAEVGVDVIATVMMKREEAKDKELTYQKVDAYNSQGQEVTKFISKGDLGNIEEILAKQGLSLVKPLDTGEPDDPTENEAQANNIIASMGGDPNNPAAKAAAMDLARHRGEITEDINNHFGTKFGEDFKFDSKEDKLRAQLADTMVPRIMLLEGKERGQAIKESIEFANQMIPSEEDVLDTDTKDTKKKDEEETPSMVQKLIDDKKKQQQKQDNLVSVSKFAGQDIQITKQAEAEAKKGNYERAIQEVMVKYNLSRQAAIESLSEE